MDELKKLKEQFAALNEVIYLQLHHYNKCNEKLLQQLKEIKESIEKLEREGA